MPGFDDLPPLRGSYVVHLYLPFPQIIKVGRLGSYCLPVGHYLYAGSARGAGGLRARLGRHLRGGSVLHWHIDYLRAVAEVHGVLYTVTDRALECEWSQALAQLPYARIPVPHFGSSDCRSGCRAHLIAFPRSTGIAHLQPVLEHVARLPLMCPSLQGF